MAQIINAGWAKRPARSYQPRPRDRVRLRNHLNHFPRGSIASFKYPARKQDDGNFRIDNLDIFKACKRANPLTGEMQDFGEEFCRNAVEMAQKRENSEGYLPPAHIGHHAAPGQEKPFAGNLSNFNLEVGPDGIPTVKASLVNIPPQVFAEIMAKRLGYRSVEIKNPQVAEFSSLALLSSETPFHKMPLTQVELLDSPAASKFWAGRASDKWWDAKTKHRVCFAESTSLLGGLRFYDQFDFARQQQMQTRSGQMGMPHQGEGIEQDDDSMVEGLPQDVIEQLMQRLQGGQQNFPNGGDPAGQQQPGADSGIDAETQQALGMNGAMDMTAQLQALGQQIVQGVTQGVAQLLAGNNQQRPAPPVPVGNSQPTAHNAVNFAQPAGQPVAPKQSPIAPVTEAPTAAQFNELVKRLQSFEDANAAQAATIASLKERLDPVENYFAVQQEKEAIAQVFSAINSAKSTFSDGKGGVLSVVGHEESKLKQLGFGESQIDLAVDAVTKKLHPHVVHAIRNTQANFSDCGTSLAAKVPVLFAELLAEWRAKNVVPSGVATGGDRPAAVPANGVVPQTTAQVSVARQVTDADIKKFSEMAPHLAHHFSENNGRAESVRALGEFFSEFDALAPQVQNTFKSPKDPEGRMTFAVIQAHNRTGGK